MTRMEAERIVSDMDGKDSYVYWADYLWGRWIVSRRHIYGGMKEVYKK